MPDLIVGRFRGTSFELVEITLCCSLLCPLLLSGVMPPLVEIRGSLRPADLLVEQLLGKLSGPFHGSRF